MTLPSSEYSTVLRAKYEALEVVIRTEWRPAGDTFRVMTRGSMTINRVV